MSDRRWIDIWARIVGMPVGRTDDDRPEFLPISQLDVRRALMFRTFWILMHTVTCAFIIASSGKNLGLW